MRLKKWNWGGFKKSAKDLILLKKTTKEVLFVNNGLVDSFDHFFQIMPFFFCQRATF